jgi:uncharacterized protein YsxB (DUF464 family)
MSDNLTVIIYKNEKKIIGFDISGHANFDEHGRDIVCAGVSVLAETIIAAIDSLTNIDEFDYKIDVGHTFIRVNPKKIDKDIELLFKTFELGVKGIQNSYKNYINIIKQEVN